MQLRRMSIHDAFFIMMPCLYAMSLCHEVRPASKYEIEFPQRRNDRQIISLVRASRDCRCCTELPVAETSGIHILQGVAAEADY